MRDKIAGMDKRINEPTEESETAARYRKRAEQLRAIACDKDGDTGTLLADIAVEYERMAAIFDGLDRSHCGRPDSAAAYNS